MKKRLKYSTIALSLIMGFGFTAKAEPSSNQLTVYLNEDDIELGDEESKGWRMPSQSMTCIVDFTTMSIITERIPMVISYELMDNDGERIIASYSNDYDMVSYVSSLTGVYRLRLVTAESCYIGYIEL